MRPGVGRPLSPVWEGRILFETAKSQKEDVQVAEFAEIKSDYEQSWLEAKSNWCAFWERGDTALRATAGQTWRPDEVTALKAQGRDPIELNLIRPNINFFSGYMRDNIKSVVSSPKEQNDQESSDEMTDVMKFVWDKGDGLYTSLNAFDHCLSAGISLWGIFLDFSQDTVNGDIRFFKRSYNSFALDPNFSKLNLEDCGYVIIREFVTRDEAKNLIPEVSPEVIDEIPSYFGDNKFNLLRPRQNITLKDREIISFDSYYRQTTRTVRVLIDLDSGEEREITDKIDDEQLEELLRLENSQGANLDIISREKPSVEYNIILSGEPVFSGRDPLNIDAYPFVPIICYFEPDISDFALKIQGIATGQIDAQRIFNKRQARITDFFDSAIDGGQYYKPSKLVDSGAIYQSGNYKNIPVKNDASPNDFWPINQGQLPGGAFEYLQTVPPLLQQIAGVNESVLGMDEGGNTQVSGHLAQVRIASGLRANRAIFDNFEQSQRIMGSLVIQAIQNSYSDEKIERIIGKPPSDKFKLRSFERFDSVVKLNVQSQTQRDAYYFELLRLREILGPEGVPASDLIEALPMVEKSEFLKNVKQREEQAQQVAQKQQEMEELLKQFEIARVEGEMTLNELRKMREVKEAALTRVKISEVEENMANATLDRAKAIAEIQKVSDERLIEAMRFIKELEEADRQKRDIEVQKSIQDTQQITSNQGGQNG